MHPARDRSLAARTRGWFARTLDWRLVRWMQLGSAQQAWYLRRLLPLLQIDLVVDAGANLGQFARLLRGRAGYRGAILSVEPMPAAARALRARFAAAGIVARRLDFLPRLGMGEYLAAHREIDLLLDAFPWTSSTTAHFGLWMGVPTVTRAGESLVARLGAATMAAAGLEEFVAESAAEYVAISVRAAARPDDLQRIRAGLRSRLEEDARRVPAQVARTLERRLRQMWQRWCAGLPACVLD